MISDDAGPDVRDPRNRALRHLLQKRAEYGQDRAARTPPVPATPLQGTLRRIGRSVASFTVRPGPSDPADVDLSFLSAPEPLRDLEQSGWDPGVGLFDADQFAAPPQPEPEQELSGPSDWFDADHFAQGNGERT